jgi:hypothetical protein
MQDNQQKTLHLWYHSNEVFSNWMHADQVKLHGHTEICNQPDQSC